jgi:hypothetical protein
MKRLLPCICATNNNVALSLLFSLVTLRLLTPPSHARCQTEDLETPKESCLSGTFAQKMQTGIPQLRYCKA